MTNHLIIPAPLHSVTPSPVHLPTPASAAKRPFVPPVLTQHGQVAAVTQKNRYAPFFQQEIVAETSP